MQSGQGLGQSDKRAEWLREAHVVGQQKKELVVCADRFTSAVAPCFRAKRWGEAYGYVRSRAKGGERRKAKAVCVVAAPSAFRAQESERARAPRCGSAFFIAKRRPFPEGRVWWCQGEVFG